MELRISDHRCEKCWRRARTCYSRIDPPMGMGDPDENGWMRHVPPPGGYKVTHDYYCKWHRSGGRFQMPWYWKTSPWSFRLLAWKDYRSHRAWFKKLFPKTARRWCDEYDQYWMGEIEETMAAHPREKEVNKD